MINNIVYGPIERTTYKFSDVEKLKEIMKDRKSNSERFDVKIHSESIGSADNSRQVYLYDDVGLITYWNNWTARIFKDYRDYYRVLTNDHLGMMKRYPNLLETQVVQILVDGESLDNAVQGFKDTINKYHYRFLLTLQSPPKQPETSFHLRCDMKLILCANDESDAIYGTWDEGPESIPSQKNKQKSRKSILIDFPATEDNYQKITKYIQSHQIKDMSVDQIREMISANVN